MNHKTSPLSLMQHIGFDACAELIEFARHLGRVDGTDIVWLLSDDVVKLDEKLWEIGDRIATVHDQIEEARRATEARAAELNEPNEIRRLREQTESIVQEVFLPEQRNLRARRDRLRQEMKKLETLLGWSK